MKTYSEKQVKKLLEKEKQSCVKELKYYEPAALRGMTEYDKGYRRGIQNSIKTIEDKNILKLE